MPALTGRIRQLFEAIVPGDPGPCAAHAASILSPALLDLFSCMAASDQVHACRVARDLAAAGWTSPAAAEAALLHDVGKSCGTARARIPDRVALVLLRRFAPATLTPLLAAVAPGFDAAHRHPAIGAACLRDRGAEAYSVWLVGNHERRELPGDPLLAALIAADDGLAAPAARELARA